MTDADNLDTLAALGGIEPGFWDIFGAFRETTPDAKRAILAAMGFDVSSPSAIAEACRETRERPWRDPLGPVQVIRRNGSLRAGVALPADYDGVVRWLISLESGEQRSGESPAKSLPVQETRRLDGQAFARYSIALPNDVPDGYHRFHVETRDGAWQTELVIAPTASYVGAARSDVRHWGIACQLYAVRSAHDWGMGDFGTLFSFSDAASRLGAAAVGVNPFHALLTLHPDRASPYLPSSRTFLNPLYIDVPAAADAEGVECADFDPPADTLRRARLVDYPGVSALKRKAFVRLYEAFNRRHPEGGGSARRAAFDRFRADAGNALTQFCVFQALHEHFQGRPWPTWPPPFQDVDSADVRAFAHDRRDDVLFHAYLQWLADQQLGAAAERCAKAGMAFGLYRDIAVGADPVGADAWAMQDVLAQGARIGAPPDAFNPDGQDWGMPPPRPHVSRRRAHRPFTAALGANMRHAGALRIDHAMALQRLYWIPPGASGADGAYVRYPMDELLGLVALESHRNRCVVIGEDLGTVTDEFRDRIAAEEILSYRVFYFERYPDRLFKRPDAYPAAALATARTHDLPTIRGHWVGHDVAWWAGAKGSTAMTDSAGDDRAAERVRIVGALKDQDLVDEDFPAEGDDETLVRRLIVAINRFIARSPARLVMVNLDDALTETEPFNIPGTIDEYPNWRRRHATTVEELLDDPFVRDLAAAVAVERRGSNR